MTRAYIERLHRYAARQGKQARMVIVFPDYEAEVVIRRK